MTRLRSYPGLLLVVAILIGGFAPGGPMVLAAASETDLGACSLDDDGKQTTREQGYWLAGGDGGVFAYGQAPFLGSANEMTSSARIVAIESSASHGYWVASEDGEVFAFGGAQTRGSAVDRTSSAPIVGMTAAPYSSGYRLVDADGRAFHFGQTARDHGDLRSMRLNAPVAGIAAPTLAAGDAYWIFARDGGVFAFGEAGFFGSATDLPLNAPIVAMAATITRKGYWLVGADGGVFTFGDARFFGSVASLPLVAPIVGIETTDAGDGYWLVGADGGVFAFGDAKFFGSAGDLSLAAPVAGIAVCRGPGSFGPLP